MKTSKKGISLIVLVITIIVMIVLAAAIILSLSSSGIIGRANEAKSKTDVANAKQVVAMAQAEWQLDEAKLRAEYGVDTFKAYANKKLTEAGFTTSGNGGISLSESGAVNTIYVDSKGKQAIIPEGFTVSTVSTEKTVDNGLVIKDEKGNEFVWVPVEYTKSTDGDDNGYDDNFEKVFVTKDGYASGSPQTFVSNGDATEPYSTGSYTEEEFEYNKMKASVQENRGFYIARYEAGLPEGKTTSNVTTGDLPVSKKGADVWNYIAWGTNMTTIGTTGAVYRARQMYKGSNSVTSTLCYGVQWDAAMNFMKDVSNPNVPGKKYIEDSTEMGYYALDSDFNLIPGMEEKVQPAGYYAVKNIYDMAGNIFEWTMEANSTDYRGYRGGYFRYNGTFAPASNRNRSYPDYAGGEYGFRPALYLK